MTKPYQPPFTLTHGLTKQVADIAELLGQWKAANPDFEPMAARSRLFAR